MKIPKSKVISQKAKQKVASGRWSVVGALLFMTLCLCASVVNIQAQTTEFTYQGRLLDSALPPTANYDFQFSLWDSLVNGTQQGTTQTIAGVAVSNGIFTIRLDFGNQFPGSARFLQIAVRAAGGGTYTTLAPRQPITNVPYAVKSTSADVAAAADTATTAITAGNVTGVVAVANGGTGSSTQNFVDLSTDQNVDGNKAFAGAVAVGTTAQSSTLTVVSQRNTTTDNTAGFVNTAIGPNTSHIHYGTTGDWYVRSASSAGKVIIQDTGGNVGIGTATPTEKLDVAGNIKFTGTISGDGSGLTNVTANTTSNLSLLGSLRWDVLRAQNNFTVGISPQGVAFDGTNVWVSNGFISVTKLRASDGATLGTFTVGGFPLGLAFDGANIWVAGFLTDNVIKLRASDGANLGAIPVGTSPRGVAFDGANIWVANFGTDNVTKLRVSDGASLGTFPGGTGPYYIAFDGANIWVTNVNSDNVTKLRASDGANLGTFPVGQSPHGLAFDGANIWVANGNSSSVTKLRASDGANLGTFPVGNQPWGVAFDGANIWVTNANSNNVTKLRASDGASLGTFPVGTNPQHISFDGANIWVTNSGSGNVTKLPVFP